MPTIRPVKSECEVAAVAQLARIIWTHHFTPIIGEAQVEYMLNAIQSSAAIAEQIGEGVEYYLLDSEKGPMGYFALSHESGSLQLSKIYVLPQKQGEGLGSFMLSFVEARCRELCKDKLWLTVNRNNATAVRFYKKHGFQVVDETVKSIGEGFVMDDYIMSKKVARQADSTVR